MSERSVGENNKLWEAAEKIAEKAVLNAKIENAEERRKQKKRIVKIILLMTFIALIIVFASIAWFAMNKAVTADTMAVEAAEAPFEIATKGERVRYETEFSNADSAYTDGETTTITGIDHITSSSKPQIRLRYDPTADQLANGEEKVGPKSSGKIELYIVPKQSGTMTVKLDLNIVAFRSFKRKNGEVETTELIKMNDLTAANSGLTEEQIAESKKAEEYLNGHIMFFEHVSSSPTLYSYTDPITDGVLQHTFNATENTPETIEIYWMWTNTLGQIALKNNDCGLRNGVPVVDDVASSATADQYNASEKKKVIDYLKDNKEIVFKNLEAVADLTEEEKEGLTDEQLQQAYKDKIDDRIDHADTETNFKLLSEGYNSADFSIGTNVDYFIFEITATAG